MSSDEPIDSVALERLRDLMEDEFDGIVAQYLEDAAGLVDALADAVDRGDTAAVHRDAHSLRSSSTTIGATRVSAYAGELESLGLGGAVGGAAELVSRTREELARVAEKLGAR